MKLTRKQAGYLRSIKYYIQVTQMLPCVAELAAEYKVHPNAARGHVEALEKKGAVTITDGKPRGIRPVKGFRVVIKGENI